MAERRLSLLESVSLNMSLMVGIGPFITLPALVGTLGLRGPQSMIGWVLGGMLALADGMVWSELAAAYPGSGGTYHFYDAAYGASRVGRILKFLFVWQFFFSGPLEVASGAIGLTSYLGYFFPFLKKAAWNWGSIIPGRDVPVVWGQVAAMGVMLLVTALAYRRVSVAGKMMVVLWIGMLFTVLWVTVAAASRFDARLAFDFPEGAFHLDYRMTMGMGMALALVMYNFFGYYQICYMADEVADPSRTIPRSILISVLAVGSMFLVMSVAILGVVPWRDVIVSKHIASDLMLTVYGPRAAGLATMLIVWTAIASLFAALLGYSRIPYASAKAGHFFKAFATLHPTGLFPHRVAAPDRRHCRAGLSRRAEDGDRCARRVADPDPVRGPDRDGFLFAIEAQGTEHHIPYAAVPPAGSHRARGLGLHLRDLRTRSDSLQHSVAGCWIDRFLLLECGCAESGATIDERRRCDRVKSGLSRDRPRAAQASPPPVTGSIRGRMSAAFNRPTSTPSITIGTDWPSLKMRGLP